MECMNVCSCVAKACLYLCMQTSVAGYSLGSAREAASAAATDAPRNARGDTDAAPTPGNSADYPRNGLVHVVHHVRNQATSKAWHCHDAAEQSGCKEQVAFRHVAILRSRN